MSLLEDPEKKQQASRCTPELVLMRRIKADYASFGHPETHTSGPASRIMLEYHSLGFLSAAWATPCCNMQCMRCSGTHRLVYICKSVHWALDL